ncbi:MAG: RNA methyltransferase, partial [Desulfobacterales bacterium]
MPKLYVALTHYPVVNKNGDTIASALTNLDLHDISRAAMTYGVKSFYVVTPLNDQQLLARRIISHWTNGAGAAYNPARRRALEIIRVKESIEDAAKEIENTEGIYPKTAVTCARQHTASLSYEKFGRVLENGMPYLLVFGTAWGLAETLIAEADYVLQPIT